MKVKINYKCEYLKQIKDECQYYDRCINKDQCKNCIDYNLFLSKGDLEND